MSNPWLTKNPFMSMWMSGANSIGASMRGQAKRQAAIGRAQATNQIANFWANVVTAPPPRKKKRR
jgi:hypothetical protein